jgi:hypothetical protein
MDTANVPKIDSRASLICPIPPIICPKKIVAGVTPGCRKSERGKIFPSNLINKREERGGQMEKVEEFSSESFFSYFLKKKICTFLGSEFSKKFFANFQNFFLSNFQCMN